MSFLPFGSRSAACFAKPARIARIKIGGGASFADKYDPLGHRGYRVFNETWYEESPSAAMGADVHGDASGRVAEVLKATEGSVLTS